MDIGSINLNLTAIELGRDIVNLMMMARIASELLI